MRMIAMPSARGDSDADRCRRRSLSADPDAPRRPRRLFCRAGGHRRPRSRRPVTVSGSTAACPSSSCFMSRAWREGDLGNSLTSGQTVLDDLRNRLPASLELTLGALLLAFGVGIPLGIGAAVKPGGWVDRLVQRRLHRGSGDADLLSRPASRLRLLLSPRLGAGARSAGSTSSIPRPMRSPASGRSTRRWPATGRFSAPCSPSSSCR